jgi:hypothetical protein
MGIIGWVLLPLVGSIIAVITGHMAKKEIRESQGCSAARCSILIRSIFRQSSDSLI